MLPLVRHFHTWMTSPLDLLLSRLYNPSPPNLSFYFRCYNPLSHLCDPLLDVLQYVCVCLKARFFSRFSVCRKND